MTPAGPTPLAARVEAALAPRRSALVAHPLYAAVDSVPRLRRFMGEHVFAVWDFMCLLKRLQRELTCVDVLWRPPPDPVLARFVNEVVLVEESDAVLGGPTSHLELYRRAMGEVEADGRAFDLFLAALTRGAAPGAALVAASAPAHVRRFVEGTLEVAQRGTVLEVLACFLLGREEVIPDMFRRLLARWSGPDAPAFAVYLERHIAVDGDSHGPLARAALERALERAGDAAIDVAVAAGARAIEARLALWDGVLAGLGGP